MFTFCTLKLCLIQNANEINSTLIPFLSHYLSHLFHIPSKSSKQIVYKFRSRYLDMRYVYVHGMLHEYNWPRNEIKSIA